MQVLLKRLGGHGAVFWLCASLCLVQSNLGQDLGGAAEEDELNDAVERRLATFSIDWTPPLDPTPAGGGPPVLYAGANYTSFRITSDEAVTDSGRLALLDPSIHYSGAQAGHCLSPLYFVLDKLPPLDASMVIAGTGNVAEFTAGIIFAQGGIYKLCWSPDGTFGIGQGFLVPEITSEYRIFGATDTCQHGPGCLAARRFFCHVPHVDYLIYGPLGTQCFIFIQTANTAAVYSRLTWTENSTTDKFAEDELNAALTETPLRTIGAQCPGQYVGPALFQSDKEWAREVAPLSRIDLGRVRTNLTKGFHYRLCYCPSYDASTDGVCGELSDFVQQVGYLDGLMIGFIASNGEDAGKVRSQVIALTRFTMKVDCGGPWCGTGATGRVKVVAKSWDAIETNRDLPHWDDNNGCPDAVEVKAWHSPDNCISITSQERLASNCSLSGGNDSSFLLFEDVRFHPKFDNNFPVAQIFDVCFVHAPLELDGLSPETFNRTGDDAMQNTTRTWWKIGQLVIEPLWLLDPYNYVMNRPVEVRIAPMHLNRTSTLHDDYPELPAAGENVAGPIIKIIEETVAVVDSALCAKGRPIQRDIAGLACVNSSWCTPRATKRGEELVLDGGDPAHRITFRKAGIFAVCYCEKWKGSQTSCEDPSEWMLVGKTLVTGVEGNQDWVLDMGVVQSFTLSGYGFSDMQTLRGGRLGPIHTVRILDWGATDCRQASQNQNLASTSLKVCSPINKGRCQLHSIINGRGFKDDNISDIPGELWRHNSTFPSAVIKQVRPDSMGASVATFAEVAVLTEGDTIHFEDNIEPSATHWRRKEDLDRIVRGADHGYTVLGLMDAGRQARIPLSIDPYPELTITPPEQGRWWRSNKLKVGNIKGMAETNPLLVCWGIKDAEDDTSIYYHNAGYITWVVPNYFDRTDFGLTSTAAGTIAPIMLTFLTSNNPKYREARNPMQLRVAFLNTSVIAPALSGGIPRPLERLYDADQPHEASQAVCGRLFSELYSTFEYGFPVPRGCWIEFNRYGAEGRVVALYIIFEALNGLKAETSYTIVMNAHLKHAVSNYTGLSGDDPGLVEITSLDDMFLKPEGVVDIAWMNPDKPIIEAARVGVDYPDGRFLNSDDARGGVAVRSFARSPLIYDPINATEDVYVHAVGDSFGMAFFLKGSRDNPIRRSSIVRIYMWPLTVWQINHRTGCEAECVPQEGSTCNGFMSCEFEATQSVCMDFVPPKLTIWRDNRGRECTYYEAPGRCQADGLAYTPEHGYTAIYSCCTCLGGVRMNSNIVKMQLPSRMDPAKGSDVVHTVRFWQVTPMPQRGFFATRFGAQVSDANDERPDYVTTSGRYILKMPSETLYSPVATLVDAEGWGNPKQFKNDPDLNNYYLRLQLPATLYGTPWEGTGYLAKIDIVMPVGFQCKMVVKAAARGQGDDRIELPVLPFEAPTGKGGIAESTTYEGGNESTPGAGYRSGKWEFDANRCTFYLERFTALFDHQRVYLWIFALNPSYALPRNDPRNFWQVSFTSSGDSGAPAGHRAVCFPYDPPRCTETGEAYYANPLGAPSSRSFELLYPNETDLSSTIGPLQLGLPLNKTAEPNYTTSFPVLGIIEDFVVQPRLFHLGAKNALQIWFTPDSGNWEREGYLGVQAPVGFSFGDPCVVRDLPHTFYSRYSPPFGKNGIVPWEELTPRVYPVEDMGACSAAQSPRWSLGGVYVTVKVHGSLVPGRRYGFEIDILNPGTYDFSKGFELDVAWAFKLSITDKEGYGRDGTYSTAAFFPNITLAEYEPPQPPPLYMATVLEPIVASIDEMQPFRLRPLLSRVEIGPIVLAQNVSSTLRITAPTGFEWAFTAADFAVAINGSTPLPGGVPLLHPDARPNVIAWDTIDPYVAGETYAFATFLKVPVVPPRASANAFYFEWGYNGSGTDRLAAARAVAPRVRSLRDLRFEMTSTNVQDKSRVLVWVETVTNISENGTLEIEVPEIYATMLFKNTSRADGDYCDVEGVEEFGSLPLPPDTYCRRVRFPGSELRLVLFANSSGFGAGMYVLEFNVTNPGSLAANPALESSPCGRQACVSAFSKDLCGTVRPVVQCPFDGFPHESNGSTDAWSSMMPAVSEPRWRWENDFWTTTPALRITTPMEFAEIVDMNLDEKLAIGRDDRPRRRSAIVVAMMLRGYRPAGEEDLHVRAPVGWEFDSVCDFWTASEEVFPPPLGGLPPVYQKNGTVAVRSWPSSATVVSCRGDFHHAVVKLRAGLQPQELYMFRIGIKRNPLDTPWRRNTWSLTLGTESSGPIPGFKVATFSFALLDPILFSWSDKDRPTGTPVGLAFNVSTTLESIRWRDQDLSPIIRVIAPPLFEVVVQGISQDIQGGDCYVVLQEEGNCRLCGVPFHPDSIRCRRDWNRKNVAIIMLLNEDAWLYSGHRYQMWVTFYNPHIENSEQRDPAPWVVESFLGQQAPPAVAPYGYALDYADVDGFKISERAMLAVVEPAERNGSVTVEPQVFEMSFPTMLDPGEEIELRAPPGFRFQVEVPGYLELEEVDCMSFEYLPVVWPTDAEMAENDQLVRPPVRPPIPPPYPAWFSASAWLQSLPLEPSFNSSNCSEVNASDANASSCLPPPLDATQELVDAGLPSWALRAAVAAHDSVVDALDAGNNTTVEAGNNTSASSDVAFLVLRNHCIANAVAEGLPAWETVPGNANLSLLAHMEFLVNGSILIDNRSAYDEDNISQVARLCLEAAWVDEPRLVALEAEFGICRAGCLQQGSESAADNSSCLANCSFTVPVNRTERCSLQEPDTIPPNATAIEISVSNGGLCTSTCCGRQVSNSTPICTSCYGDGVFLVQALWYSVANLSDMLDRQLELHEAALTLRRWDTYPLQSIPRCIENKMFFRMTEENLHPERELLNKTVLRFRIAYQNPSRPPMWFMNFWTVRHWEQNFVVSSAAVQGWVVISRLRYVRAELHTEVLKRTDPAVIHFEFVTVNPANELKILPMGPETFNFSGAFIESNSSTFSDYGDYWRGFTEVEARSVGFDNFELTMAAAAVQYVRFRIGGIRLPWTGGQALFSFFSSIRGLQQDELQHCCPPGFPANNPGVVFFVPHRFYNLFGSLKNRFMTNRLRYPIASGMETRLNERHSAQFVFFLPERFRSTRPPAYEIAIVIRSPAGYVFLPDSSFVVQTLAPSAGSVASSDSVDFRTLRSRIWQLNVTRAELLLLADDIVQSDVEYRLTFEVMTPETHAERIDRRLWVFEVTDRFALENAVAAPNLGVYDDFDLYSQINFTVYAPMSPPEVVIVVHVTFIELGETNPIRLDVFGPTGFQFLMNCLAPGQEEAIAPFFVSCRERWSIWNGNYLSGANLMSVDGGVDVLQTPITVKLLARTPAQTPATNTWYVRGYDFDGLLAWGLQESAFPVRPMEVDIAYAATASTLVPLFLAMKVRMPLPFNGHVHLAAPRLYQLFCPVVKVLQGPMMPDCTQTDPVLTGCWGLPSPSDLDPPFGLPLCDPLHEVLLTFTKPEGEESADPRDAYVLKAGDSVLLSLEARVPASTPYPRTENVFRVRLMDESKATLDGKLNEFGAEVIDTPRLQDFRLWWTSAAPSAVVSVAVEFSFNTTMGREEEEPGQALRVIQIDAPQGFKMAIRKPTDVIPLDPSSELAINEWNWTGLIPQGVWFGLDLSKNVSGRFHYSIPVLLPGEGQMPFNNLWRVRLCADSPFCEKELLVVPIPGFFFGEQPTHELSQDAYDALMGGGAVHRAPLTAAFLGVLLAAALSAP